MEAWLKKLGLGPVNAGMFDGTWRGGTRRAKMSAKFARRAGTLFNPAHHMSLLFILRPVRSAPSPLASHSGRRILPA